MSATYRLAFPPPVAAAAPVLDEAQRAVVRHRGGPLLVLAGPGTGKTTTIVEAVVDRVSEGLAPDRVLVLTFSRRAAAELRERITARLGVTVATPAAWTFHAFCYALVRAYGDAQPGSPPVRLLSAPEQDVVVRDLLSGSAELDTVPWPLQLRASLRTRGLAEEVRGVLARCREVGLEPTGLAQLAAQADRDDWTAVAAFFAEYLDVLDALGALDYAELVHRAVSIAGRPDVRADLRARFPVVFVDEYQDTDPAQEALLRQLAGDGRDLVVVGDPDQAIYAFRGADVDGLLRFPERFPTADRSPAPILSLRTSRRAGTALLSASRVVARRLSLHGLPTAALREHRELLSADSLPAGEVTVRTYPSAGAEAEAVADLLRRAHLETGLPWARMAVLVRSGVRSIPLLRRVLSAAGVPLEVAGDELPLAREPGVAPLLLALRCADEPAELTAERARALLLSPLVGADPAQLRRLGRALREAERASLRSQDGPEHLPRSSSELIREAVAAPLTLGAVPDTIAAPAQRLGALLDRARAALAGVDGSPEQALWELWSGSAWSRRLPAAADHGGAGGRAADRDLDAVVALFEAVGRAGEQRSRPGVGPLLDELEAQRIPGDTLAERSLRGDAVRLLTAHRSKGLEWDLVVVTGVQEGVWPDLRQRGSLLQSDRITGSGAREPTTAAELLVEERRLFYVAVTRARERLVVTSVASAEDDGERPSRFLDELGTSAEQVRERVRRPLATVSLVAALRSATVDPDSSPALQRAAALRLARLAAGGTDAPAVAAAHPRSWWGLNDPTHAEAPMTLPGERVRLSGTSVSDLSECPLRWFLSHEVHATKAATAAMGFGGVLHALADEVARGRTPADLDEVMRRLDRVWAHLAYEAPWLSHQQHEAAREALGRFLVWHSSPRDRTVVGTEVAFTLPLDLPGGPVLLRGFMDRVEIDHDGRVHVVDLKTGKKAPPEPSIAHHPQLATYQLAVRSGALDERLAEAGRPAGPPALGGAELVQLRVGKGAGPKVQPQPPLVADEDGSTWIETMLDDAVRRVLAEDFPASPGLQRCERCDFRRSCPAQPEGRQVVE